MKSATWRRPGAALLVSAAGLLFLPEVAAGQVVNCFERISRAPVATAVAAKPQPLRAHMLRPPRPEGDGPPCTARRLASIAPPGRPQRVAPSRARIPP